MARQHAAAPNSAPSRTLLTPTETVVIERKESHTSLLDPVGCSSLIASRQVV
jgi:hypothetical protein